MEAFAGVVLAVVLVLAGCGMTFLAGMLLPSGLAESSRRHGRFAGLEASGPSSGGGSGRRVRVGRRPLRAGALRFACPERKPMTAALRANPTEALARALQPIPTVDSLRDQA